MLQIEAVSLSKKYSNLYIIKQFNQLFHDNQHFAIKGSNGRGKSTLIKMLCGFLSPSGGSIQYHIDGKKLPRDQWYKYITIAAPYAGVIQDFTLEENLDFLMKFKALHSTIDYRHLVELLEWKDPKDKLVRQFSSGMQQKVNVCFSLIAQSKVVFLDEPTSYLDTQAKEWYLNMLALYGKDRMIITASNDSFDFSDQSIHIDL